MSRKSRQRQNSDLGFVSVRVMADYGSSGLWLTYPPGWYGSSGISCEALRLPAALSSRFAAWIETYVCQTKKTFDPEAFNRTGRELAQALKEHLGPQSYVEFVPEPQNDDDAIEIEIIE